MGSTRTARGKTEFAVRAGAASIYLFVGVALGVSVAVASIFLNGEATSPSFAAIVFSVSAASALLAGLFPNAAFVAISPIAHLVWGLLNGALVPESTSRPEYSASSAEKLLFWVGAVLGCILLFLLLFMR